MKRSPARAIDRRPNPDHLQILKAMYRLVPLVMLAAISSPIFRPAQAQEKVASEKCPPPTHKDDTVETIHGVSIADPYRWLEDQNNPETRSWIDAQDRCTDAMLDSLPGRTQISKRLTELMKVDSFDLPMERNGSYFFMKRRSDQDLFVIYQRRGLEGGDEVLVDPHPMSVDHSTSVGLMDVSHDGSLAAYNIALAARMRSQSISSIRELERSCLMNSPRQTISVCPSSRMTAECTTRVPLPMDRAYITT